MDYARIIVTNFVKLSLNSSNIRQKDKENYHMFTKRKLENIRERHSWVYQKKAGAQESPSQVSFPSITFQLCGKQVQELCKLQSIILIPGYFSLAKEVNLEENYIVLKNLTLRNQFTLQAQLFMLVLNLARCVILKKI